MHYFVFVIFAVVVIFIVAHKKSVDECWKTAARSLKLRYRPGALFQPRVIKGKLAGFKVRIHTIRRSSGKYSKTHTVYQIFYPSLGLGLTLRRQGIFSGLSKLLGGQDIVIGHSAFDDNVVIRGNNPRDLKQFLTLERRLRIQRFFTAYHKSSITDFNLKAEVERNETIPERMVKIMKHLVQLAQVLNHEEASDSRLTRAMDSRKEGSLEDAFELVEEVIEEAPEEDPDVRAMQGEILLTAGRGEEAARALQQVRDALPDDEDIRELTLQAEAKRPPVPVEADANTQAIEEPEELEETEKPEDLVEVKTPVEPALPETVDHTALSAPAGPSIEEVSEALFSQSRMSFETNKIFEEAYKDKQVQWTGTLDWVTTYYSDMVFGSGPGTRAVFKMYHLKGDNYGGRKVQAVVQLPKELEEELSTCKGKVFEVEGTMVSCDAFMRNIFLAEGVLHEKE